MLAKMLKTLEKIISILDLFYAGQSTKDVIKTST